MSDGIFPALAFWLCELSCTASCLCHLHSQKAAQIRDLILAQSSGRSTVEDLYVVSICSLTSLPQIIHAAEWLLSWEG